MVYPPNGQSFPGNNLPTRNCDGRLIIDFISKNKPNILYHFEFNFIFYKYSIPCGV
uniref:Uncharacterized protein n=1 Tax=Cajanus cajan TaxID=3821 RepID=A0A151QPK6_CAJCA|nr:hypothetical protein KK1_047123 [Cajanus cajan]